MGDLVADAQIIITPFANDLDRLGATNDVAQTAAVVASIRSTASLNPVASVLTVQTASLAAVAQLAVLREHKAEFVKLGPVEGTLDIVADSTSLLGDLAIAAGGAVNLFPALRIEAAVLTAIGDGLAVVGAAASGPQIVENVKNLGGFLSNHIITELQQLGYVFRELNSAPSAALPQLQTTSQQVAPILATVDHVLTDNIKNDLPPLGSDPNLNPTSADQIVAYDMYTAFSLVGLYALSPQSPSLSMTINPDGSSTYSNSLDTGSYSAAFSPSGLLSYFENSQ